MLQQYCTIIQGVNTPREGGGVARAVCTPHYTQCLAAGCANVQTNRRSARLSPTQLSTALQRSPSVLCGHLDMQMDVQPIKRRLVLRKAEPPLPISSAPHHLQHNQQETGKAGSSPRSPSARQCAPCMARIARAAGSCSLRIGLPASRAGQRMTKQCHRSPPWPSQHGHPHPSPPPLHSPPPAPTHLCDDALQLLVPQRAARQLAQHNLHVITRHSAVACEKGGRGGAKQGGMGWEGR